MREAHLQPLDDSVEPESCPHFINKWRLLKQSQDGAQRLSPQSYICTDQLYDLKHISGPQFTHL